MAKSIGVANWQEAADNMAKAGERSAPQIPPLRQVNQTALELFFRWECGGFHKQFDSWGVGHLTGFDWSLLYGWARASEVAGEQFEVMERKFQMLEQVVLELRGAESRALAEDAANKSRNRNKTKSARTRT